MIDRAAVAGALAGSLSRGEEEWQWGRPKPAPVGSSLKAARHGIARSSSAPGCTRLRPVAGDRSLAAPSSAPAAIAQSGGRSPVSRRPAKVATRGSSRCSMNVSVRRRILIEARLRNERDRARLSCQRYRPRPDARWIRRRVRVAVAASRIGPMVSARRDRAAARRARPIRCGSIGPAGRLQFGSSVAAAVRERRAARGHTASPANSERHVMSSTTAGTSFRPDRARRRSTRSAVC